MSSNFAMIEASEKGSDIDEREASIGPEDLTFYNFYETHDIDVFQKLLYDSQSVAKEIINQVFDDAFDVIMEKYYLSKVPENISKSVVDMLEVSIEGLYKRCDEDDMDELSEAFACDEQAGYVPIDSYGRARLKKRKLRDIPDLLADVKVPDYVNIARKEFRKFRNESLKFIKKDVDDIDSEDSQLPEPIELDDKKEFISIEEQQARAKKIKELKENAELERKLREEAELKKLQEKMGKKERDAQRRNQKVTYDYSGRFMIVQPIPSHKLSKVQLEPIQRKDRMGGEQERMVTKIKEDRLEKLEKFLEKTREQTEFPKRTREKALEEILKNPNTVTNPVFVTDHFEAESGVTLIEGGRTKTNQSKRIYKFETTGSLRMNKTQYTTKIQKDRAMEMKKMKSRGKRRGRKKITSGKTTKRGDNMKAEKGKKSAFGLTRKDPEEEDFNFDDTKTIKVASIGAFKELIFSKSDANFFANRTVNSLREKLQQKKNQKKRMAETMQAPSGVKQTTTDHFNMRVLKNRFLEEGTSGEGRRKAAAMMPRHFKRNRSKGFRKTQKKFVISRYRSQKNLVGTKIKVGHAAPPPLGKTFGHGLFKKKKNISKDEDEISLE